MSDGDEVTCIDKKDDKFIVTSKTGDHESKTMIIATGRKPKLLGVAGEKEFKNKGVTYCATCDGPLFSGKDVAIIGGGNSAMDAVMQMMAIASHVYIINTDKDLSGDLIMKGKIEDAKNVTILNNAQIREISGSRFVEKITVDDGSKKSLDVQGVFVQIGSTPVKEVGECEGLALNDDNEIIVNARCETNIPGLFAAGDVTDIPEKQIITAAGHGCIASLSAFKYISKKI